MLELVREMGAIMQEFTQSGGVRPFGVSLLIAGCVLRAMAHGRHGGAAPPRRKRSTTHPRFLPPCARRNIPLSARSYDDSGPQLFQVDPSGAYFGWRASAIGKNFTNAKTFLEKVRAESRERDGRQHATDCR